MFSKAKANASVLLKRKKTVFRR